MKCRLAVLAAVAICSGSCGPTHLQKLQSLQEDALDAHLRYEKTKADDLAKKRAPHLIIGMSGLDAMGEWGFPDRIKTTETAHSKREQWVYPDLGYLYFENDRLVAIQRNDS
jgi:hypothetical protein